MKLRVSDTNIIITDRLNFVEIDGRSIHFHFTDNKHESIYNNEMEAMCVFNNINHCLTITDARFESKEKQVTEDERKEKGFEMFWNLYDKKIDKNKAKKSFMNLTLEEMIEAVKGVKAYVDSTPDKKYRKDPTTWIRNKCWNNEISIDKKNTNRYVKPKYHTDER